MFAAVGTDGARAVVWGLGATVEEAVADAESNSDGSFEVGSVETHEITAAQAAIVEAGDVSWPIAAVITDLEWRDSADETVRGWWYTYDGVDCMLVDPMTWDANADRAEVLRSVAHHRRVDSVVEPASRQEDETMTTKTQFFVTAAPGHYGDRTTVLSAHHTLESAKKKAGAGYAVRRGTMSKGATFLRADEAVHPVQS